LKFCSSLLKSAQLFRINSDDLITRITDLIIGIFKQGDCSTDALNHVFLYLSSISKIKSDHNYQRMKELIVDLNGFDNIDVPQNICLALHSMVLAGDHDVDLFKNLYIQLLSMDKTEIQN